MPKSGTKYSRSGPKVVSLITLSVVLAACGTTIKTNPIVLHEKQIPESLYMETPFPVVPELGCSNEELLNYIRDLESKLNSCNGNKDRIREIMESK